MPIVGFDRMVRSSFSYAEVLRKMGLVPAGGNYRVLHKLVKKYDLDVSHFTGQGYLKGRTHGWARKIPLEEALTKDSPYKSTHDLKVRLLKAGLLEYHCYNPQCGISVWNGLPLVLELEHINGVNTDHRLENLILLCPNCHSQTPTYRGRNRKCNKKKR